MLVEFTTGRKDDVTLSAVGFCWRDLNHALLAGIQLGGVVISVVISVVIGVVISGDKCVYQDRLGYCVLFKKRQNELQHDD